MGIGVGYKVRLSPDAKEHAREARGYYRKISPELAKGFQIELREKLKGLETFNAFPIRYKDTRRLNMEKFPYCIYFVVYEAEALVDIIAIYHQRQKKAEK